jgi:hypothetical protein
MECPVEVFCCWSQLLLLFRLRKLLELGRGLSIDK